MALLKLNHAIEVATQDQKDALLELVIQRQNRVEEIAELTRNYKEDKKPLEEALTSLDTRIFEILEEIDTGQRSMFDGGDDGSTDQDGEEEDDDDETDA